MPDAYIQFVWISRVSPLGASIAYKATSSFSLSVKFVFSSYEKPLCSAFVFLMQAHKVISRHPHLRMAAEVFLVLRAVECVEKYPIYMAHTFDVYVHTL